MAWGYQSDRIFKLQKRAIRIVANSKYNAHTEPLFKLFRILKISDVLILQTMKVYHKFRNKELPVYMQNWPLIINNEIHQYNTRIASDLHTFRYHHTFAKKSLRHFLVQTINNTPDNVFSKFGTHSLNGFLNYVKLNLLLIIITNSLLVICLIYFPGGPMIATITGLNRSLHVGIFNYFIIFIYITVTECCMLTK